MKVHYRYQNLNVRFKRNVPLSVTEYCKLNKEHYVHMNFLDDNDRAIKIDYGFIECGFEIKNRQFLSKNTNHTTNSLTIVPKDNAEYTVLARFVCDGYGHQLYVEYVFDFIDNPMIFVPMSQGKFDSLFEIIAKSPTHEQDMFFNFFENNLYEYPRCNY